MLFFEVFLCIVFDCYIQEPYKEFLFILIRFIKTVHFVDLKDIKDDQHGLIFIVYPTW